MGSTQRANDPKPTSQFRETVFEPIADSLLLKIAMAGVVLIALGAALNGRLGIALGTFLNGGGIDGVITVLTGGTGTNGELMSLWSAIFAVWGSGLVLVGLVLYGFVWWRRH